MEPREDDPPYDESDHDPLIRELRTEMVRLQARLDQLTAATRDQAEEAAELRARLTELEVAVGRLRARYRRAARFWGVIGLFYGAAVGMWVSWLFRP